MVTNVSASRRIFCIANVLLFLVLILVCAYPIWYILIQSLSGSIVPGKALLLPHQFTLSNYQQIFKIPGVLHAVGVSFARTIVGTGLTTTCCMLMGYLFSKQTMPGRKFLYRMLTITMYVSGGLIPTYLAMKSYMLLNSFWVYVLPSAVSAYYVILIKTYVEQLPAAIEESAMIDGANVRVIFFRIILPMSLPIMATIMVYASVAQWNAWFDNHIYTFAEDKLTTMQYLLYNYLNEAERLAAMVAESAHDVDISAQLTPKGLRMTMTMITVLPVLMFYPFLQRFFIKGIVIGAVKG